ncbi:dTDP-4-dehydrorhamnose 3,5-epimerase [Thermovibrio ammonificans]
MPFDFKELPIPGLLLVESRLFKDGRGFFMELFKLPDFEAAGIKGPFVQDNLSLSRRNVLRGLHYQVEPAAQGKLVTCLRGKVFDVAVDLRKGSPTFGRWFGTELFPGKMLYIPEGFAHGFLTLSEEALVFYKVTGSPYSPEHDRSLKWNDPQIGIEWPLDGEPILSEKDRNAPSLSEAEINFRWREQ